ncbi:hypothetical protein F5Y05DRAFT_416538 [Hypoxylon sp. FL0543]|nr:hypothetical protein F5Y05DRAFT_416538 [Hypoxylon sp. FL0543]
MSPVKWNLPKPLNVARKMRSCRLRLPRTYEELISHPWGNFGVPYKFGVIRGGAETRLIFGHRPQHTSLFQAHHFVGPLNCSSRAVLNPHLKPCLTTNRCLLQHPVQPPHRHRHWSSSPHKAAGHPPRLKSLGCLPRLFGRKNVRTLRSWQPEVVHLAVRHKAHLGREFSHITNNTSGAMLFFTTQEEKEDHLASSHFYCGKCRIISYSLDEMHARLVDEEDWALGVEHGKNTYYIHHLNVVSMGQMSPAHGDHKTLSHRWVHSGLRHYYAGLIDLTTAEDEDESQDMGSSSDSEATQKRCEQQ